MFQLTYGMSRWPIGKETCGHSRLYFTKTLQRIVVDRLNPRTVHFLRRDSKSKEIQWTHLGYQQCNCSLFDENHVQASDICSADCKFVAKSSPGTMMGGLMSPCNVFFSLVRPRTSPDLECPDNAEGPQPNSAQVPMRSTEELKLRPRKVARGRTHHLPVTCRTRRMRS